jgi:hypothetical protein
LISFQEDFVSSSTIEDIISKIEPDVKVLMQERPHFLIPECDTSSCTLIDKKTQENDDLDKTTTTG